MRDKFQLNINQKNQAGNTLERKNFRQNKLYTMVEYYLYS